MRLAPTPQLTSQHILYSDGVRGIEETIALMRQLVDQYKRCIKVRSAATAAVYLQPEKDDLHEVNAIFESVRDGIRYVRDVLGVETIHTPDKVLETQTGDCDDKSTLLCAMLESIGYQTRFVVAAYTLPGHFEHVYAQVFIPAVMQWVNADTTERGDLGYAPPNPLSLMVENV